MNDEQPKSWYNNNPGFNKIKKPLYIIFGIIVFYTLLGFLILPWVIKSQLPDIVHEQTGKTATVQDVKFNPYQLALSMQGFEMTEPEGEKIIGLEELFVDIGFWGSIRHMALAFDSVTLYIPFVAVKINAQGAINLAELAKTEEQPEPPEEEPSDELFPLYLQSLKIVGGVFDFSDLSLQQPYHTVIKPIDLEVEKFATIKLDDLKEDKLRMTFADGGSFEWDGDVLLTPVIKSNGNLALHDLNSETVWNYVKQYSGLDIRNGKLSLQSDYSFELGDDGTQLEFSNSQASLKDVLDDKGELSWHGAVVAMPETQSSGVITITGVSMQKLWQFLDRQITKGQFGFNIRRGELNLQSDYEFAMQGDKPQLNSSGGWIKLTNFDLSARNSEQSIINIAALDVQDIAVDLLKQQLNIGSVSSDKSSILTHIGKDGEVNFTQLFAPDTAQQSAAATAVPPAQQKAAQDPASVWLVNVAKLTISNYNIDVTQETEGNAVKMQLSPLSVKVQNFSTKPGSQFDLDVDTGVNKIGKISSQGKVGIDPIQANLDIKADQLALKPFQPYLDQSTKLKLTSGDVGIDSKIDLAITQSGELKLDVQGHAGINNLRTVEAKNNKEFLKWKAVDVNNYKFSLDPMQLDISTVNINGINTEVIINEDRSSNLSYIFSAPKGSPPAKKTTAKPKAQKQQTQPFRLNIDKINVKNSAAFYADRSLILPFGADIKKLHGTITKISTNKNTRTKIHLEGKVNKTAPALIKGSIEPFDFEKHLDILMQFEGIDMTGITPYMAQFAGYKVEKGKLSVDLHYLINNKQLNATNQVVIDQLTLGQVVDSPDSVSLPVSLAIGLLKDRNGVIDLNLPIEGSLDDPDFSIFGLIGGVLLNVVTKVVTAPFSMIAGLIGSDADLSQISFTPGNAEIGTDQSQLLDTLAEGLKQRPQLKLEIRGVAFKEEDGKKLAQLAIDRQIKSESPDPDDYYDELEDIYDAKFPKRSDLMEDKLDEAPDKAAKTRVYDQMMMELIATVPVANYKLNQLAKQRAQNIMDYLTDQGQVSATRVFILDESILPDAKEGVVAVELKLGAD